MRLGHHLGDRGVAVVAPGLRLLRLYRGVGLAAGERGLGENDPKKIEVIEV